MKKFGKLLIISIIIFGLIHFVKSYAEKLRTVDEIITKDSSKKEIKESLKMEVETGLDKIKEVTKEGEIKLHPKKYLPENENWDINGKREMEDAIMDRNINKVRDLLNFGISPFNNCFHYHDMAITLDSYEILNLLVTSGG